LKEKIIGLEKDSFLLNNRSGSTEKRQVRGKWRSLE
jgi:hypothetical protein